MQGIEIRTREMKRQYGHAACPRAARYNQPCQPRAPFIRWSGRPHNCIDVESRAPASRLVGLDLARSISTMLVTLDRRRWPRTRGALFIGAGILPALLAAAGPQPDDLR